jgi:hypothetical protein
MELTAEHENALWAVRNGGDIFSLSTAMLLRDCQEEGLVTIGAAMGKYGDGTNREPYFGAMITAKGKKALKAALNSGGRK